MSIDTIELWHKRARPEPTAADFNVQLGCHLEELVEMLDTLVFKDLSGQWYSQPIAGREMSVRAKIHRLATELKTGNVVGYIEDREGFLDSLADQVVTAVGAAHCAGMRGAEACDRVNASNWTKFDQDGQPIRDQNGKITKGPKYQRPVLDGLY